MDTEAFIVGHEGYIIVNTTATFDHNKAIEFYVSFISQKKYRNKSKIQSNPTHQRNREMCRIVQVVGIIRFYFSWEIRWDHKFLSDVTRCRKAQVSDCTSSTVLKECKIHLFPNTCPFGIFKLFFLRAKINILQKE